MAKITKERLRAMKPGDKLIINCVDEQEVNSTYQTAAQVNYEPDYEGCFSLTRSLTTNTVIVRRNVLENEQVDNPETTTI